MCRRILTGLDYSILDLQLLPTLAPQPRAPPWTPEVMPVYQQRHEVIEADPLLYYRRHPRRRSLAGTLVALTERERSDQANTLTTLTTCRVRSWSSTWISRRHYAGVPQLSRHSSLASLTERAKRPSRKKTTRTPHRLAAIADYEAHACTAREAGKLATA
jgi:hypothetical protein